MVVFGAPARSHQVGVRNWRPLLPRRKSKVFARYKYCQLHFLRPAYKSGGQVKKSLFLAGDFHEQFEMIFIKI
jgi:hypothetical protein